MEQLIKTGQTQVLAMLQKEPLTYLQNLKPVNIKLCILSESPTLGDLKQECLKQPGAINCEELVAIIVVLITDLVNFFSVGKSMTGNQCGQTAELLIGPMNMPGDFDGLKLDDIKLCFDYIKKGRYGKVYDRIDGAVIFEKLELYRNEVKEYKSHFHVRNHQAVKLLEGLPDEKQLKATGWSKERLDELKELGKALSVRDKPKVVNRPNIMSAQQAQDNIWLRMFDKLYDKFKITTYSGQKISGAYIQWRGKILSPNEFLVYKNNQYTRVINYLKKRNEGTNKLSMGQSN